MSKAKSGDKVKVHYTGKVDDGKMFDTSRESEPLEFTIGAEQIIPGFEEAVIGLEVGEIVNVSIKPADAYGEKRNDLILDVPPEAFGDIQPEVGEIYEMSFQDEEAIPVVVTEINEVAIIVDANHPLAGETLHFEIELMEILA